MARLGSARTESARPGSARPARSIQAGATCCSRPAREESIMSYGLVHNNNWIRLTAHNLLLFWTSRRRRRRRRQQQQQQQQQQQREQLSLSARSLISLPAATCCLQRRPQAPNFETLPGGSNGEEAETKWPAREIEAARKDLSADEPKVSSLWRERPVDRWKAVDSSDELSPAIGRGYLQASRW